MNSQPRGPKQPSAKRAQSAERVYGLSAALAAFAERPQAVVSIAHTESARQVLAPMLRQAARLRIAYREVDEPTLARMAESVHHEGVCLLVRPKPPLTAAELVKRVGECGMLIALDGVQNPHNIGAILRSAAYFGAAGLLYSGAGDAQAGAGTQLSAAARRVAEGGAELVEVVRVTELAPILQQLTAAGLRVVGSDARAGERLEQLRWPERSVVVLGHEQHGLSPDVRARCQTLVRIAGSDQIDSLNVSVAAGIFLASYAAAHGSERHGA